ncbi:LysR family transcriptional regulator [Entomohabitans teleogrylli]|uniref:LysR family transcriptional regulator n=1 Tax=Entomohabitans teleogrylli TaxID=1384589 RepID=UPI00073D9765|nr:LysR family transcriptional regulator [Entomohabitans teleogrylli]
MALNPNDLLLFIRVVEEGSFTRAAEKLALPKSTLSRRISLLENVLGELLLRRSTRKLSITDFGHTFYLQAKRMANELDIAAALGDRVLNQPCGLLRISMPGDFTSDMLGEFLARFMANYPAVMLEIDVSQRRVDLTGENYDLAIRMGTLPDDATLVARRIASFHPGLYVSPDWLAKCGEPQRPEELLNHQVLSLQMRANSSPLWTLSCGEARWQGSPQMRVKANAPGVLREMAIAGAGIACLAGHFVRDQVIAGTLRQILTEWTMPEIPVWAVFPGRRLMPARTRLFIEKLQVYLQDV